MTTPLFVTARRGLAASASRAAALTLIVIFAALDAHAQTAVSDPFKYTRTSAFTYNAAGLLETETIEPTNPQACITTKYAFDRFGNRTKATTANTGGNSQCANASGLSLIDERFSQTTFNPTDSAGMPMPVGALAPLGTFATKAIDALDKSETRVWDARFGVMTGLTGPNALTTTWELDDFGRKTREIRADGTSTLIKYCLLASPTITDLTSDSANCTLPAAESTQIPTGAVRFEHVEPQRRDGLNFVRNGPYSRTFFDAAGRKLRSITQAFDGDSDIPAGRLIAQDTVYNEFGAASISTQPYFTDTKASLAASAANGTTAQYGLSRTDYDILGRPVAVYTTDPLVQAAGTDPAPSQTGGTEASINFNGQNYRASKTTITYTGLDTLTTTNVSAPTLSNPAAVVSRDRYEHKNPDGKVVAITDHYGAQVAHQHDAFGNLVATKDARNNQITIEYDVRGRKLKLTDPDAGVTVYCYDALGQLKAQQSSAMRGNHVAVACPTNAGTGVAAPVVPNWTTMAYDKLGRMTERIDGNLPAPAVASGYKSTWSYDNCLMGVGKLCTSITDHGVKRKYAYDDKGRPISVRTDVVTTVGATVVTDLSAISGVTYDSAGRIESQIYPTGLQVAMHYTPLGYLKAVKQATTVTVNSPTPSIPLAAGYAYITVNRVNAWGKAELTSYGNGVNNRAMFEPLTGRLLQLTAGTGSASGVVDQRYGWDNAGQLTVRVDQLGDGDSGTAVMDRFSYDNLGRLKDYTVVGNASPVTRTVSLRYNALGMLIHKTDVGNYSYPTQGPGSAVPHGVRSIAGTHNAVYTYDLNGNVTTASGGKYRNIEYNSFNLPNGNAGLSGVPSAGATSAYTWHYDENHQRIKETRVAGGTTRVTWSLHPDNLGGLAFEREVVGATKTNRHYLSAGGASIGVIVTQGDLPALAALNTGTDMTVTAATAITATKFEYWHKDHLGSLIATTDKAATVTLRMSYDAFGKRRGTNSSYDADGNLVVDWLSNNATGPAGTDRGYTGHEHLDDLGVIHMNGRLFDPLIGRFMQADPLIQDPLNLQNFDRYGYCYNNPLTCTDPSGYSFNLFRFVASFVMDLVCPICGAAYRVNMVAKTEIGYQFGSIAINVACYIYGGGPQCVAGGQAAWAAIAGHNLSSSIKIGIQAGVSSYVNGLIGGIDNGVINAAAHAAWGCAEGRMSGGGCAAGARGAIAYSVLKNIGFGGNSDSVKDTGQLVINTMVEAAAGGLASVAGGGSFAQGARSAAMAYLFNQLRPGGARNTRQWLSSIQSETLEIRIQMAETTLRQLEPSFSTISSPSSQPSQVYFESLVARIDSLVPAARLAAVREAWRNEVEAVRNGTSTYNWTFSQARELLSTGSVSGFQGHHTFSVSLYPQYAGQASFIRFYTPQNHIEVGHGGNWRNPSHGP